MSDRIVPVAHLVSLYRELVKRYEMDLTVYSYSDAAVREFYDRGFERTIHRVIPLLDGYRAKLWHSAVVADATCKAQRRPNWDIIQVIISGRYDVIWAHGYAHPHAWLGAIAARPCGTRLLIRQEQTLLDRRPWHKRALRQVAFRAFFRQASELYIGEQNWCYFQHYGRADGRLFLARYCVDNQFFREQTAQLAPRRGRIQLTFGITDAVLVILFCGKFVEKKQPLLLLAPFKRVRQEPPLWLLIVVDVPYRFAAEGSVRHKTIPFYKHTDA